MDERTLELKCLKRASGQVRRKYVAGWKGAAIVFLALALLLTSVSIVAQTFDNEAADIFGGSFWQLKNPVADTYTKEVFDTQTFLQAQTEGIVLLKNENNVLPLKAGAVIEALGHSGNGALLEKGFSYGVESDTAIAHISYEESTGEMQQVNREDLEKLLNRKANGQLKTLVVLLSGQMPADRELLQNENIDAILWGSGIVDDGVANVLTGVSPAGALVETWRYNAPNGSMGIYNGYKYYETRYEDYVMGTGNAGNFIYSEQVAYPFGFGLRYTEFAYSQLKVEYDPAKDRFNLSVTVTNEGDTPGKEPVQVYAQTPYTDYDKENAIEKPAVSLVGFGKTGELAPGASETVTVYVDRRDLASYDASGAGTYILDGGNYYLTCATNAHNAVNNILAAKGYTPENTDNRMDGEGNTTLTYTWQEAALDTKTYAVSKSGATIQNSLPVVKDTCVSRQDWEGTLSRAGEALHWEQTPYSPADYPDVAMPTMGAKNGMKLQELVGLAYDDPKWQTLLDQLSFDDMLRLVTDGYGFILPVKAIQSPGAKKGECTLPVTEALLAATFNPELMLAMGKLMGNDALSAGTPIVNLSAEDYEDSLLAGKLRSALAQGMGEKGIAVVLNGTENAVLPNEQVAREDYWRQFRYAVEENPAVGVSGDLPAAVLQQWGNHGVRTAEERPTADGILSGITSYGITTVNTLAEYENDPVIVTALRQACHNNLYVIANSAAMNGIGNQTVVKVRQLPLVTACFAAAALCWVLYGVFGILWLRGSRKWKKTVEYLDYKTLKNTLKQEKEAVK